MTRPFVGPKLPKLNDRQRQALGYPARASARTGVPITEQAVLVREHARDGWAPELRHLRRIGLLIPYGHPFEPESGWCRLAPDAERFAR